MVDGKPHLPEGARGPGSDYSSLVFMTGFCSSLYRAFGRGTIEVAAPSCGFIHKKTVRAQEFPHDTTAEASPPSDQRTLPAKHP